MTSGELIEALKAGKVLYRKVYNGQETEYFFSYTPGEFEMRGFESGIGSWEQRIKVIINEPEQWKIHSHPSSNVKPYPWSFDYKEIVEDVEEENITEEFILNTDARDSKIQAGIDRIISNIKYNLNQGYKNIYIDFSNSDINIHYELRDEVRKKIKDYLGQHKNLNVSTFNNHDDPDRFTVKYIG